MESWIGANVKSSIPAPRLAGLNHEGDTRGPGEALDSSAVRRRNHLFTWLKCGLPDVHGEELPHPAPPTSLMTSTTHSTSTDASPSHPEELGTWSSSRRRDPIRSSGSALQFVHQLP